MNPRGPLSACIRKAFASDSAWRILDAGEQTAGTTWSSGSCWLAAEALRHGLGTGVLYALVTTGVPRLEGRAEHVLLKIGDKYLDAAGSWSGAAVKRWWSAETGYDFDLIPLATSRTEAISRARGTAVQRKALGDLVASKLCGCRHLLVDGCR